MMRNTVIVLCLLMNASVLAQPVVIKFTVGSELATKMKEVTDEHVDTEAGPYYFKDVQQLTFQFVLPDSATIEKLKSKGIVVYLRWKRITPIVQPVPVPSVAKSPVGTVAKENSEKQTAKVKVDRQETAQREYTAVSAVGLGLGLDYGGIGMKVTFGATSGVSVVGGLGYNFHKLGYNAGLEFNFTPHDGITGFLSAMYGYNAVLIQSSGTFTSSETFYGPSFGLGIKSRSNTSEDFFTFQIIYPVRDPAFLKAPKADKPWPVLFSFGYHFGR